MGFTLSRLVTRHDTIRCERMDGRTKKRARKQILVWQNKNRNCGCFRWKGWPCIHSTQQIVMDEASMRTANKKNKKEGEGDKNCHRTQAIACYYQHGHNIRSHRRRRPHNHDVSSDVALNSVGSSHIFNMDFVLRWLYIDILINLWSEFLMNESCHIFSLSLFLCVCFRNNGKSNEHSCIQLIYRYPWPKWQFSASLAAQSAVHFVSSFLRNN